MTGEPLLILGNNITALAVARAARRHRLRPTLFDRQPGVAFHTRWADRVVCPALDEPELLDRLERLPERRSAYLIAVSDDWLRFLIRHRAWLEAHFGRVLHAGNPVLTTCLDKAAFSAFCRQHDLPTPRVYEPAGEIHFPAFLRPTGSSVRVDTGIPKAVHLPDAAAWRVWRDRFESAGVPFVLTESLLTHRLTKYSVALARNGQETMSFVAEQLRPGPDACAVGSYVRLAPDPESEALARRAADCLGYEGLGEVEILHSHDTGRRVLIEFNARPWLQYALAEDSHHPMLGFLIDRSPPRPAPPRKTGRGWLCLGPDLYVCFSRSEGYVRHGRLGWGAYLRSMLTRHSRAVFHPLDPLPGLATLWATLRSRFPSRRPRPDSRPDP